MSRRAGNNVRGPTSALTSFLQAQGINAASIARRVQLQNANAAQEQNQDNAPAEQEQQEAGPSTPAGSVSPRRRGSRRAARTSGYASDDLDASPAPAEPTITTQPPSPSPSEEPEEGSPQPAPKRRKLTKAAEAKLKAAAKKRARKAKGAGSEYEESDDEDDEFIPKVGGMNLWSSSGAGGSGSGGGGGGAGVGQKPAIGSLCNCGECGKQFAFTKYSLSNMNGEGYLCHPCAKASGNDPFKKKPAPKRKVAPTEKRNVQSFEERRFPTLVSLCIDILSKHIDDIEAFGDIGSMNVDAISKALSKNRCLTPENATLFYNVTNTSLVFYDATNLTPDAFTTLAHLNPNLTTLRLDFCGQLDDVAMGAFTSGLPALERIELLGPFLVRVEAWKAFFKAHSKTLTGFLMTQSPRFDLDCAKALVACKGVKEVRLKEVGKMSDEMVKILEGLGKGVKLLDLSYPGNAEACTPEAIEGLLKKVAAGLDVLDLSGHALVDDESLAKGLVRASKLRALALDNMLSLTDDGLAKFFSGWSNPALRSVSLARNHELGSEALKALIAHSGSALEELNVNGWGGVDEESVKSIMGARELRKIDVGFVRAVDDFVVLEWVGGVPNGGAGGEKDAMEVDGGGRGNVMRRGGGGGGLRELKEVKVWGCNRVTERCPRRAGLSIYGVESQVIPVR